MIVVDTSAIVAIAFGEPEPSITRAYPVAARRATELEEQEDESLNLTAATGESASAISGS